MSNQVLQYFKKYAEAVCLVFISVLVGAGALMAVYSLPTGRMFRNAQKSTALYQWEGDYPSWARGKLSAQLDNFTDSIMVRKVIFPGTGNVVRDAMLNPSHTYKNTRQVPSLVKELKGETKGQVTGTYARYWHGYLLFLKPALLLRPVQDIRELNGLVQIMVALYIMYLLAIQYGKGYSIAYFLAYLTLNPVSLAMSFQFSSMYYIASFGILFLLKKTDYVLAGKRYILFFTTMGILTAFFDFLTYPAFSFGMPLIVMFLALDRRNLLEKKIDGLWWFIESGAAWAIGYGGMYIGKWILSWVLTGHNTWLEATKQATYRMSTSTSTAEGSHVIHIGTVIVRNLQVILKDPVLVVLLAAIVIAVVMIFRLKGKTPMRNTSNVQLAMGLAALIPFAWYFVLSNHSYVHYWFTYRELGIFVFAIGCLLVAKV